MSDVAYLTLDDIVAVINRAFDPPAAVRDWGLLESAIGRHQAIVLGEDVYPGVSGKAAALVSSLVSNHALVDGNRRLGLIALRLFLVLNGYVFVGDDDAKYTLIMDIAEGMVDVQLIAGRLSTLTQPAQG